MNTQKTDRAGFTLVEIMIVVAIIGLLAAIAIPNFVRARNTAQQKSCINNLRQLDAGKQQWALENKKSDTDTPTADNVKVYLKNNIFPTCPSGTIVLGAVGVTTISVRNTYSLNAVNTDPTCIIKASTHLLPAP